MFTPYTHRASSLTVTSCSHAGLRAYLVLALFALLPLLDARPLGNPPPPGEGAVLVQIVRPPGETASASEPTSTPAPVVSSDSAWDDLPECDDGYDVDIDFIDPSIHAADRVPPGMGTRTGTGTGTFKGLVAAETIVHDASSALVRYYREPHTSVAFTSRSEGEMPPPAQATAKSGNREGLDGDAARWLGLHNAARADYGAGVLMWDEGLRERARRNAQLCTGDHS